MTDEASLNFIKNYFKEQGQDMTSNNKQQALVIEDAIVLPNKMVWLWYACRIR